MLPCLTIFIIGSTVYDTEAIYNGDDYSTEIELKDGTIEMYVYSYALAKLVVLTSLPQLSLPLFTFLLPTFLFIRRKVNYMTTLKNEVTIMSQGDLDHTIKINSNDEIAELSNQIDNLRLTLKTTLLLKKLNRKANYELVTALSHDLRTPLTFFNGIFRYY